MIMQDKIEIIGRNTVIQHGEHNKRIYLIKLDERDIDQVISLMNSLAREEGYTKIFCKVPVWAAPVFNADGYIMEAHIPGFYNGEVGVSFMSKFLNSDRLLGIEREKLAELSRLIHGMDIVEEQADGGGEKIIEMEPGHAEEISAVYREVFRSYPFPIHDPGYIEKTMKENIRYFGVRDGNRLIALSSAEMDRDAQNCEMTDFATLPEARGRKLSRRLLAHMEAKMAGEGIRTLYTIARLNSMPMNKTFLGGGYTFSGTLINNTNISGSIESMNVLYKHI